MSKVTDSLNLTNREYWPIWKNFILNAIDGEPKEMETISRELGIIPGTDRFNDLTEIVSSLQMELKTIEPKIRSIAVPEERIFLLYRVDQEKMLIERGLIFEEEACIDLEKLAKNERF